MQVLRLLPMPDLAGLIDEQTRNANRHFGPFPWLLALGG